MQTGRFLSETCFNTESFVLWKAPFCGKIPFCGQLLIAENPCLQKALIYMNPHLVGIFFCGKLFFGAKLYFAENSFLFWEALCCGKLHFAKNPSSRHALLFCGKLFFRGELLIAKTSFLVGMSTLRKTSFRGKPLFARGPFFAENSFFAGSCFLRKTLNCEDLFFRKKRSHVREVLYLQKVFFAKSSSLLIYIAG